MFGKMTLTTRLIVMIVIAVAISITAMTYVNMERQKKQLISECKDTSKNGRRPAYERTKGDCRKTTRHKYGL